MGPEAVVAATAREERVSAAALEEIRTRACPQPDIERPGRDEPVVVVSAEELHPIAAKDRRAQRVPAPGDGRVENGDVVVTVVTPHFRVIPETVAVAYLLPGAGAGTLALPANPLGVAVVRVGADVRGARRSAERIEVGDFSERAGRT
jgi:hypothetical protein